MGGLRAEDFFADPRLAQARELLRGALADHQGGLAGVRPPRPELEAPYAELLGRFEALRGGPLFYPYLASGIGRGPLVELADGSVKFDFISGIGVHFFGHSHPALLEAGLEAALAGTVMQGNLQQDARAASFLQTLVETANRRGASLDHGFLTTSGAMANENALKLVFHKRSPAGRLLAFERCFAGRTLALAQVTDQPAYRAGLPAALRVDYVPFFDAQRPRESAEEALSALRRHLARHPGQHAAMIFELVQGEGGFYPGEGGFFAALMEEVKEAGAAVLIDEIQTFGRTTQPFAFQHFGLDAYPDVVTVGKLTQVCATLFRGEYKPPPGLVSQTFTGSTSAIRAARAILGLLLEGDYFGPEGRIARLGAHCERRLREIEARHPGWICGPYGVGAMVAFTVFDGDLEETKRFLRALFEAGVIGFYAGDGPARVRFLIPAGALSPGEVDAAMEILEATLSEFARSR